MSDLTPSRDATDRLRDIQAVTDAALAHLDVEDLLAVLLDRVREILRVDTSAVLLVETNADYLVATAARGIEEEVVQGVRIPLGRGFAGRIAAEKRAVIIDHVDHTTVMNPILRDRGIKSMLGVPLLSGGEVLGVLHVGTLHKREFTAEDVDLLQLVADRIALATRARLSETERSAALALQHSLLPGRLPLVSGIEFGARYVPGEAEGVGGDWYDVFALSSGELCVVMGDVVGRGLRAAVVMGRLRSTLRAYALTTTDPAKILSLVDRKLQHFEPGEMATVLLAVFDLNHGRLLVSAAGHLPPILAGPDGSSTLLELPIDPPVGVPHIRPRHTTDLPLPTDAVLCLYTDGLVERRRISLDDRIEILRAVIKVEDPETVCASVMGALVGAAAPADDVALLVVRFGGASPDSPLHLDLPAIPTSLAAIRTSLRRWLHEAGATGLAVQDLLVAVGEATANAVEHAYGPAGGSMTVHAEIDGHDAVVEVSDEGQWRDPRGKGRGRGTRIMQNTTDVFRVERGSRGSVVYLRRRLNR
ncbi:MAG TPA: SpoIIE family protein phosphatase [Acidimicrobiales bacterium]|jgi:serine phosphatase RsbU (regulator of sigma subunit)/anti-sigma regulatory factor (Ser/Thr protein kinase)|nr:SpoIIE family protein phosphatase [Acidimicrobiales bacterium]